MFFFLFFLFLGFLYLLTGYLKSANHSKNSLKDFRFLFRQVDTSQVSHEILEKEIQFYINLDDVEKELFRKDMVWFLTQIRIIGVGLEPSVLDRHLVAASGIIPIFRFPEWQHYELDEVLLFEDAINFEFETGAHDSQILGMVGTGKMARKMALSRRALNDGFSNKTDKHNTALHEFIHLVDIADGRMDGLPQILMDKQYALPWLKMIREKIVKIKTDQSDIDPYGATNLAEFFAVSGEYFFERPDLLKIKHPELYDMMDQMFRGKIGV